MKPTMAMDFTNCSICFCSGDFTSLMLVSDCPILPSFVSFPIFSTLKTASPETVNVPLYTLLSSDELSLKTEKLSPVMEDSFTEKSLLRTITPSALMISPSSVTQRSPTVIARVGISTTFAFLITLLNGSFSFSSASNAFLLLLS